MSRTRGLVALLVTGLIACVLAPTAQSAARCGSPQPVRAFHPNGTAAGARGAACQVRTGFLTSETHIRVAPDGTVVQEPAEITPGVAGTFYLSGTPTPRPQTQLSPAGLAVSRTKGASWAMTLPSGMFWEAQDGSLHIDPASGRWYYYALTPAAAPQGGGVALQDQLPIGYAHLMTSADEGRTWVHTQLVGFLESENPRFTTGRARPGQPQANAGESVAYWCGNRMLFEFIERDCFRSLNGGQSWQQRGTLGRRGVPVHPECGTSEETLGTGDGAYPQIGPDGTLWTLVACGGKTFLARSTDEAATFPIVHPAPGFSELRADPKGILYGVAEVSGLLQLRTSRNGGASWSAPLTLTAPRLRKAGLGQWALAVRGVGQVAVAYLTDRPSGGFDGSVTVTRNALAHDPVLLTASAFDTRRTLVSQTTEAKDDFIDVDVAPDGSAWASFFGDCTSEPECGDSSPNPLANTTVILHLG